MSGMGQVMGGIGQSISGPVNGIIGSKAAVNAGNEETSAYNSAMQAENNVYDTNSAYYKPYINNGTAANNELASETGQNGSLGRAFTSTDFHASPSYQFDMQQGLNAINNSNSVRGGSLSGGTQKAMSNYGEQQANNGYQQAQQNFVNNQNQNYNQLSGLSQQGLTATQGLGQLGSNYANATSNLLVGQGNASAQETMAKAAALEGAVNTTLVSGPSNVGSGVGNMVNSGSNLSSLTSMFAN
jgi:hypothetical protein